MIQTNQTHIDYAELMEEIGQPPEVLAKLRDELGSHVPWVTLLAQQIADATTAGADRRAELQTQSMTIMFEEMVKLKQDTDTSE